jgi:hypothetical protein
MVKLVRILRVLVLPLEQNMYELHKYDIQSGITIALMHLDQLSLLPHQ